MSERTVYHRLLCAGLMSSCVALIPAGLVNAQAVTSSDDVASLRAQLATERAALDAQQRALNAQRQRLDALGDSLLSRMHGTGALQDVAVASPVDQSTSVPLPPSPPPTGRTGDVQTVGEAPTDQRQVQVAILAEQGGVITKKGRLTVESDLEYARSDRNDVVFRGVEIPEAVLIGVFDINQSRQDVLTAAGVARYGVTNRLEVNARVPYVYRSDASVLAPVANPMSPNAGQTDTPVKNGGLGDIDFGVRYQFTDGRAGFPYLIGGLQIVAPSGTDPFTVPRDSLGNALKAATGAGFWGVSPTLTAILPTDPAVLFGTIGYTVNFARNINHEIGPAFIDRVKPGNEPSAAIGIAISLNPRTSVSFGYAQTWSLGTRTRVQSIDPQTGALSAPVSTTSRSLQLGRYLFGMSYRANRRTTINWNVEIGATADAANVRTMLRIPVTF